MCRCYVKEKYEVSLRIIKTEFNERKSFFPRRQAEYNKHLISSKIKCKYKYNCNENSN